LQHDEAAKTSETAVILCSDVPCGRVVRHSFHFIKNRQFS